jgi:hypothetical protein
MRRFARLDANHRATCDLLRAVGYSVYSTASMGGGFPDFLVGAKGVTLLLELKDVGKVAKTPRKRVATGDAAKEAELARRREGLSSGAARSIAGEKAWAERWRGGKVIFATSPQDALAAVQRALEGKDESEAGRG